MRQYNVGMLYALPSVANPTPVPFAILSGIKISTKQAKEYINGNMETAFDAGGGKVEHDIQIDNMDFRASMVGLLLAGATTATGTIMPVQSEAATVPTTPFQYTAAQTATFVEDAGVLDFTAGKWLTRVASGPTTGQYSVSGSGQYTFAGADTGHNVAINYSFSTTGGFTTTYNNRAMTASVGYKLRCYNQYPVGPSQTLRNIGRDYPNVHVESIDLDFKPGGWAQQSVKAKAIQDQNSLNVFKEYIGE